MSASVRVPPGQLGAFLQRRAREQQRAVIDGLRHAAQRGRTHLVAVSPVDMGVFKNAWRVVRTTRGGFSGVEGFVVTNDAPHAGVVEAGARPHGVSAEGRAALFAWVLRHIPLGYSSPRAGTRTVKVGGWATSKKVQVARVATSREKRAGTHDAAAWAVVEAICWEIAHHGQKGRYLVRGALGLLGRWAYEEIAAAVGRAAARPYDGGGG